MNEITTLTSKKIAEITLKAKVVRRHILNMVTAAKSGHPGGSLSVVEILATLYFAELNIDPARPLYTERDRFVLSKGHASSALYAVLAERGFFAAEDLVYFRRINHYLQGHPNMLSVPGVDMSTGSLGQGLSIANGMALAARLDGKAYRVYALLGDGELQEGMVWEAAMLAAHYKLDQVTAIVDDNGLQSAGPVSEVMSLQPLADKWRAFGWYVLEISGHDIRAIYDAVQIAKTIIGQPVVIIAKTVKGKGVSGMENQANWHGKAPTAAECEMFLNQLSNLGNG